MTDLKTHAYPTTIICRWKYFGSEKPFKNSYSWTFLEVQWLGLGLPMQGAWVWSLVREVRSHMPWGQGTRTQNTGNARADSIRTSEMVHTHAHTHTHTHRGTHSSGPSSVALWQYGLMRKTSKPTLTDVPQPMISVTLSFQQRLQGYISGRRLISSRGTFVILCFEVMSKIFTPWKIK